MRSLTVPPTSHFCPATSADRLKRIIFPSVRGWRPARSRWLAAALWCALMLPSQAHAAIFEGETLDMVANLLAWVVLIIVPVIGIALFWIVHILPEKIAERRQHPQAKAIQCLCLLSLVFGGMLWPLAWLWAYSKPVLYKLAYGSDRLAHGHDEESRPTDGNRGVEENRQLRQRVAELEAKLAGTPNAGI